MSGAELLREWLRGPGGDPIAYDVIEYAGKKLDETIKDRDFWKREADKLAEALDRIGQFGRPLEAPKASYAICEINDIVTETLSAYREAREKKDLK